MAKSTDWSSIGRIPKLCLDIPFILRIITGMHSQDIEPTNEAQFISNEAVRRDIAAAHDKGLRPDLSGAKLARVDLATADLQQGNLAQADLSGANLTQAQLQYANLTEAQLTAATLYQADLTEANLTEADLSGANLVQATLRRANLTRTNLSGADLGQADLSRAVFDKTDVSGADLTGVNLRGVDLNNLKYTEATRWPHGLEVPDPIEEPDPAPEPEPTPAPEPASPTAAPSELPPSTLPKLLYLGASAGIGVIGLVLVLLGGVAGLALGLSGLFAPGPVDLVQTTGLASMTMLGVGLGGILAWQGLRALYERPAEAFQPFPPWVFVLLYPAVIYLGFLILTEDTWLNWAFPGVHVLAAVMPVVIILSFAGRAFQETPISRRVVLLQFGVGAVFCTTAAIILELILGGLIFGAAIFVTSLTPGGPELLATTWANIQDPTYLQDLENVVTLLLFPPLWITIVTVYVIVAPVVEELIKAVGVIGLSYRKPAIAEIFVWGLASGAGFALYENLFNPLAALSEPNVWQAWASVMVLRIGATMMHCLCVGITVTGWQRFRTGNNLTEFLSAYGLSVLMHAIWNGIIAGALILGILSQVPTGELLYRYNGLINTGLQVSLAVISVVLIGAFVGLTRRLRHDRGPFLS